jgi:hypothetical protein
MEPSRGVEECDVRHKARSRGVDIAMLDSSGEGEGSRRGRQVHGFARAFGLGVGSSANDGLAVVITGRNLSCTGGGRLQPRARRDTQGCRCRLGMCSSRRVAPSCARAFVAWSQGQIPGSSVAGTCGASSDWAALRKRAWPASSQPRHATSFTQPCSMRPGSQVGGFLQESDACRHVKSDSDGHSHVLVSQRVIACVARQSSRPDTFD